MSSNSLMMLDYQGPGVGLLDLPDELIEQILLSVNGLKVHDVLSLSSSCRRLRQTCSRSAAVWKSLFSLYFTEISGTVERRIEKIISECDDEMHTLWKLLFIQRYTATKVTRREINKMSSVYFHRQNLSDEEMEHFYRLDTEFEIDIESDMTMRDHHKVKLGKLFLVDALHSIVSDSNQDLDLTGRYYAKKVVRFVRCQYLTERWIEFKEKPPHEQSFYDGLVFLAQWFQPHTTIHLTHVISDVENIALQTLATLGERYPNHLLLKRAEKGDPRFKALFDKDAVLSDNLFPGKLGLQILDALNHTMFVEIGFRGNTVNYYTPANSYIDKVLCRRQGIPITLCILYLLVARRLGIVCRPVNAPRHFLLEWRNSEATSVSEEVVYVDAFNLGSRMTAEEVMAQCQGTRDSIAIATPLEVFQRMARNLVTCAQIQQQETLNLHITAFPLLKSALELTRLIAQPEEHPGFALCQINLQMNVNHREVMNELDNWRNWPRNLWFVANEGHLKSQINSLRRLCLSQMKENEQERIDILERSPSFRKDFLDVYPSEADQAELGMYAVGMIMRHKKYTYFCVIYGWDTVCKATKSWIKQMGVDKLSRKDRQPFYNVLVEDGSIRYAADENLEPAKPRRITHPLVGKYFREYHETYGYEPNEEEGRLYPEDFQHLINSKKKFY